MTCPARARPDALFAPPVFVGVWGHAVVAAEVKKANEIDAVIGLVAPVGVAAVRCTDSGELSTDEALTQATWSQGT